MHPSSAHCFEKPFVKDGLYHALLHRTTITTKDVQRQANADLIKETGTCRGSAGESGLGSGRGGVECSARALLGSQGFGAFWGV